MELQGLARSLAPWFRLEAVEQKAKAQTERELEWGDRLLHAHLAEAVIHESNNRLNNLVLQLEIIKRTESSEPAIAQAESLRRKCLEAATLLAKLHNFGRGRDPAFRPLHLNQIVRDEVRGSDYGSPKQWPVPVVLELDEELPLVPTALDEVSKLVELLVKQATAVTPRSASVIVRTARQKKGIGLIVEDKGPCVPADQLHSLFEPFTLVRQGGDDWSLAVCKTLARRLNASLRAENLPTQGMAFTVHFDLDVTGGGKAVK